MQHGPERWNVDEEAFDHSCNNRDAGTNRVARPGKWPGTARREGGGIIRTPFLLIAVIVAVMLLMTSTCWAINPPPRVVDSSAGKMLDDSRLSLKELQTLPSWAASFSYMSVRTPAFTNWMLTRSQQELKDQEDRGNVFLANPGNQDVRVAIQGKKQRVDVTSYDKDGKVIAYEVAAWDDTKYLYYQEFEEEKYGVVEPVTKDFLLLPTVLMPLQAAQRHIAYHGIDSDMCGYYYAGKNKDGMLVFASMPGSDGYWESMTLDASKDFSLAETLRGYTGKPVGAHSNYSGYKKYGKRWVAGKLVYEMLIPGGEGLAKTVTTKLKSFSETPDAKFMAFEFAPGTEVQDHIQGTRYVVPDPKQN